MQMQAAVLYRNWLAGGTPGKGLNDFIAAVPRLPVDAATVPAPIALFATPFEDENCANWFAGEGEATPSKRFAVYVSPEGPLDTEGVAHATFREGVVSLVARIIVPKANLAAGNRLAEYYREAAVRSTEAWLEENVDAVAGRTLGPVMVITALKQSHGPWAEDVGDAIALGVVALQVTVRNYAPRG